MNNFTIFKTSDSQLQRRFERAHHSTILYIELFILRLIEKIMEVSCKEMEAEKMATLTNPNMKSQLDKLKSFKSNKGKIS